MRKKSATLPKIPKAKSQELENTQAVSANGANTGHGPLPSEEDIRSRAFQKWEAAGSPGGDGVGFWLAAERELRGAKCDVCI